MTDQTGAAPAAAEPVSAPVAEIAAPVTPPNPVESSGPEKAPEPVEVKPSATVKDAIAKAEAKLKEAPKDAPKAIEAKPEVKPETKPRDETGKFAATKAAEPAPVTQQASPVDPNAKPVTEQPKVETRFHEAPKRFSDDAKAAWQTAPEPVRAEAHRAVKELEDGISQYRQLVEPIKPYMQLAQQHGTTIDKALEQYITLERSLKSSNPAQKEAALNDVFHAAGVNPREWAAQLLNQSPDQVASQQDATIAELRQQNARLEQRLNGLEQGFNGQREQGVLQEINKFAEDHPRFEELADDIAFFMKSGRTSDLSEAYQLAERLNPAPATAPAPAPVIPAILDANAHTKGSKSISGTPAPGSSPAAKRGPSPSIRDALKTAMAKAS